MSASPYARMSELAQSGQPFAVATVVRTHGSTPQTIGAKLVVSADESERPFGTLGGGCVEAEVRQHYRVRVVGRSDEVRQQFYAISVERKIKHPAVVAICQFARQDIFADNHRRGAAT